MSANSQLGQILWIERTGETVNVPLPHGEYLVRVRDVRDNTVHCTKMSTEAYYCKEIEYYAHLQDILAFVPLELEPGGWDELKKLFKLNSPDEDSEVIQQSTLWTEGIPWVNIKEMNSLPLPNGEYLAELTNGAYTIVTVASMEGRLPMGANYVFHTQYYSKEFGNLSHDQIKRFAPINKETKAEAQKLVDEGNGVTSKRVTEEKNYSEELWSIDYKLSVINHLINGTKPLGIGPKTEEQRTSLLSEILKSAKEIRRAKNQQEAKEIRDTQCSILMDTLTSIENTIRDSEHHEDDELYGYFQTIKIINLMTSNALVEMTRLSLDILAVASFEDPVEEDFISKIKHLDHTLAKVSLTANSWSNHRRDHFPLLSDYLRTLEDIVEGVKGYFSHEFPRNNNAK